MSQRLRKIKTASELPKKKTKAPEPRPKKKSSDASKTPRTRKKPQDSKRVQPKISDSYLEMSEMSGISQDDGSVILSELDDQLSAITYDAPKVPETPAATSRSDEEIADKPASQKKKKKSEVATEEGIIRINTSGMNLVKYEGFPKIEIGSFIRHVNEHGYLTNGGYIWDIGHKANDEGIMRPYWIIGSKPQGAGVNAVKFVLYWDKQKEKGVFVKKREDSERLLEIIQEKQDYIADICQFLYDVHGEEFKDYMQKKERRRERRKLKEKKLKEREQTEILTQLFEDTANSAESDSEAD